MVSAAVAKAIDPRSSGEYDLEHRIVKEDGDVRWVSFVGKAFFGDSQHRRVLLRFAGTALDLTDRILSEVALRDANEKFVLGKHVSRDSNSTRCHHGICESHQR